MIDVIKEYLVSLGMSVDKGSFDEATEIIQVTEKGIKSFVGSTVKGFGLAGTAVVGTLAAANAGIANFLGSLAKADLENEKFARKMWISKDAAEEFNSTLKVMGVTIEDLYLSPELLNDFKQLRSTINEMKPPPEFQNQMKTIRSVQFEFQRLRLESTYALQWIGFYLFKYLEDPILNIRKGMRSFNNSITKSMPKWTKNIAQFLSWIARLGIAFYKGGRDVFRMFSKLGEHIPRNLKIIGAALLALSVILRTGPFGVIFSILTAILLLLDDFYTYLEGGESAFGPFWKRLQDIYKLLKDNGVIKRFWDEFDSGMRKAGAGVKKTWDWLVRLYNKFEENGSLRNFKQGIEENFSTAKKTIKDFSSWVAEVFEDLNKEGKLSGLEESFIKLAKEISEGYLAVSKFVDKLYGLKETKEMFQWLGDFLENTLKYILDKINDSIKTVTYSLKTARAFLTGDDKLQEEANKELLGDDQPEDRSIRFRRLKPADALRDLKSQMPSAQDVKLESSVNNLPKNLEPSFKKALNDSEMVKGMRAFSQDLKSGFNLLAATMNPDIMQYYQGMSAGAYANSYMYTANATSQTTIKNENKPVFYINSTEPKLVGQEVNNQWNNNLRNVRNPY
ncbi:hypothetical protein [Brevibacillus laterosporus]|uniref:hypothetical protein n=1 Tax=Brevibacillus laterosporus TaxID=1465 RepID=UPI0018F88544|nr:hypothetical protein [Brevibacillus laterosporus]MBG9773570.1 hypothetical protein [Brevibacillus laterosporus]